MSKISRPESFVTVYISGHTCAVGDQVTLNGKLHFVTEVDSSTQITTEEATVADKLLENFKPFDILLCPVCGSEIPSRRVVDGEASCANCVDDCFFHVTRERRGVLIVLCGDGTGSINENWFWRIKFTDGRKPEWVHYQKKKVADGVNEKISDLWDGFRMAEKLSNI